MNVGIKFLTPEEYFLDEEPKPFVRDFDPARYLNNGVATSPDASKYIAPTIFWLASAATRLKSDVHQ